MSTFMKADAFNRVVKTIFADETFTAGEFDEFGRRVAEVDQLGRTRTFQFHIQGRPAALSAHRPRHQD